MQRVSVATIALWLLVGATLVGMGWRDGGLAPITWGWVGLILVWGGILSVTLRDTVVSRFEVLFIARYGAQGDVLLAVRPGLTGYWQINGRSDVSYEERVRLDRSYLWGWSFRLDLFIVARTARNLVRRRGAY
jgi:hypothetical protein